MPLQFRCETCHTPYEVKDELAGKRTRCLKCQAPLQVPIASQGQVSKNAAVEEPVSQEKLMREILDAFEDEAPATHTRLGYRLGMLFMAMAMLLLPALYVLLIVLVAAGVCFHAI